MAKKDAYPHFLHFWLPVVLPVVIGLIVPALTFKNTTSVGVQELNEILMECLKVCSDVIPEVEYCNSKAAKLSVDDKNIRAQDYNHRIAEVLGPRDGYVKIDNNEDIVVDQKLVRNTIDELINTKTQKILAKSLMQFVMESCNNISFAAITVDLWALTVVMSMSGALATPSYVFIWSLLAICVHIVLLVLCKSFSISLTGWGVLISPLLTITAVAVALAVRLMMWRLHHERA